MNLLIVESPTKAKTIKRFLGKNYEVESSFGHIRDLPKGEFGVDVEHDFKPKYVIPTKSRKTVSKLKKAYAKADVLILATDEDREGEAIAWHLTQALGLNAKRISNSQFPITNIQRIVFHEITKQAIEDALKNPREIDINLVDAQQARRILDRLVGYELSPFLWKKVVRGLSAGRVQSVAVKLIAEREKEREEFKKEEYWMIEAELQSRGTPENNTRNRAEKKFIAKLNKINGKTVPKLGIKSKEEADKILEDLKGQEYKVENIKRKEIKRNPLPPFTTSTLQQEAWRSLKFSARQTMRIAQQLYEGIELGEKGAVGLITYMRTDSLNLAGQFLQSAHKYIKEGLGEKYATEFPRQFKTKSKGAQEAHEAIRPTDPAREPESIKKYLDAKQYKLYNLIWRRAIACQMAPAVFDAMSVDIVSESKIMNRESMIYTFRANGQTMKFNGFLKIYSLKFKEVNLPELEKNEILKLLKLNPSQHFTEPPARYTEATLIKTLELNGIGRPSTYAPTIGTIQDRGYVAKDDTMHLYPTDMGVIVNNLLTKHFPNIVDIKFTARMEKDLDKIAEGEKKWVPVIKEFYAPFKKNLEEKYEEVSKEKLVQEETDKICPLCGKPILLKLGRFGKFYACSGFPECRYTEPIVNKTGVQCTKCIEGEIIEKKTKKGKIFYGCRRWPECDFALWYKPTGEKCPKCGSLLVETGKNKEKCSNKECEYKKP